MKDENNVNQTVEENINQNENEPGAYRVKVGRFENAAAKVLCVLAAVVLWFYVVGTSSTIDEKVFRGVPIIVQGTEVMESELGLSVISGYDYTVDLTLEGARADIKGVTLENITAYVDVSGVKTSGEQSLAIKVSLPKGVQVVGQSASMIRVYIDKSISVNVPVQVEPLYSMDATYSMGTPEPDVQTVNVTGPEAELNKISHARVVLDLGRINKTLTAIGKLELINKDGTTVTNPYVKLHATEISVLIPVFAYKDVPLAVDYKYGYYNSYNSEITVSPSSIKIKGDPDVLSKITSIGLPLDEKTVDGNSVLSVEIPLPEDVENVSGTVSASLKIVHKNTETREIVVTDFNILNPNGIKFTPPTGISVTFRGTKTALSLLSSNNITANIDLGACPNTPGTTHEVPVTIEIAKALSGTVYEVGSYKVDITVE